VRNSSSEKKVEKKDDSNVNDLFNLQNTSKVSTSDKWIIYKFGTAGKYKSYKDVPDRVNNSIFDRARARFRIRMNIAGILLTVTLALFYIKSGKGRVQDGENLSNISMNRIASYRNEKKSD